MCSTHFVPVLDFINILLKAKFLPLLKILFSATEAVGGSSGRTPRNWMFWSIARNLQWQFPNFFVTILRCKMDASHDMSLADEGASAENKVGNSKNVHLFFLTNDLSHFLVVVSMLTCQGRAK